jgi:predicted nucleic acid-binding protein
LSAYLDGSVLLPLLVEEPTSAAVRGYLDGAAEPLLISDFAAAEVASVLSRLVRTGALDLQDAEARLADFDLGRAAAADPIDLSAADARLTNVYVRRFDLMLRAPDALHLAISNRVGAAMVTLDKRLAAAARELGVTVIEP